MNTLSFSVSDGVATLAIQRTAVSNAIDTGKFQHPEVMTRFTLTLSQRYFDALNAHFRPDDYQGPTTCGSGRSTDSPTTRRASCCHRAAPR